MDAMILLAYLLYVVLFIVLFVSLVLLLARATFSCRGSVFLYFSICVQILLLLFFPCISTHFHTFLYIFVFSIYSYILGNFPYIIVRMFFDIFLFISLFCIFCYIFLYISVYFHFSIFCNIFHIFL